MKRKVFKVIVSLIILLFVSMQVGVFAASYSIDEAKQYAINANIKLKTSSATVKTDEKNLDMEKGRMHIDGTDYLTLSSGTNTDIDLNDTNVFDLNYDGQPGYFDIGGVIFDTTGQDGTKQIIAALSDNHEVRKSANETIFKDTDFRKKNSVYLLKRTLGLKNNGWYYGANSADYSVGKDENGAVFNVKLDSRANDVVAQRTFNEMDLSKTNSMELQYTLNDPSIQQISVICRIDFEGSGRSSSDLLVAGDVKTLAENKFLLRANLYELAKQSFPNNNNYFLREVIIHMQKKDGAAIDGEKDAKYTLEKFSTFNNVLDENLAHKALSKESNDSKVPQYLYSLDDFKADSAYNSTVRIDLLKLLQDKQVETDGLKINDVVILLEGEEYFLEKNITTVNAAFCREEEVEYPSILNTYVQTSPESYLQPTGLNREMYRHITGYKESFESSDTGSLSGNAWIIASNNGTAFTLPNNNELKYEDRINSDFDTISMEKKLDMSQGARPAGSKLYCDLSFALENPDMYEKYVVLEDGEQKTKEINLDILPYKESGGHRKYTLDVYQYLPETAGKLDNLRLVFRNKGGSKHFAIVINAARFYTVAESSIFTENHILYDALAFTTASLTSDMLNGWTANSDVPYSFDCGYGTANFKLNESNGNADYLSLSRNVQVNTLENPYFRLEGSVINGSKNINIKFDLDIDGINQAYTTEYKLGSEIDLSKVFGKYWSNKKIKINNIVVYLTNLSTDPQNKPVYSLGCIEFYNKQKTGLIDFIKTQNHDNGKYNTLKLEAPVIASTVDWYKIETDKNADEPNKRENLDLKVLFNRNIIDSRKVSATYNMSKQFGKSLDLKTYPNAGFTYTMDDPNVQQILVRFQVDTNEDGIADGTVEKSVIAIQQFVFNCNVLEEAKRLWPDSPTYNLVAINIDFNRNDSQLPASNGVYGYTVSNLELYNPDGKVSLYDTLLDTPVADVDGKIYLLRNAIGELPQIKADEFFSQLFSDNSAWITLDSVNMKKGQHEIDPLSSKYVETSLIELKDPEQDQMQGKEPSIKFTKINPTRYMVDITAENSFWLVFSESYHVGWKAYILDSSKSDYSTEPLQWSALATALLQRNARTEVKEHQMVNGYANGWWVDIGSLQKGKGNPVTFQMVLEYKPQQHFEAGVVISGLTLLFCIGYLVREFVKKRKKNA